MKPELRPRSKRFLEITVESDWITTLGLALLFVVCGLLLARDIRHSLIDTEQQVHISGPLERVFTAIAVIYCLLLAFRWPKKYLRIAWILVGARLGADLALSYFHLSQTMRHSLAVAGSAAAQIALAIFLVAIAQWFRSMTHWDSRARTTAGDR